MFTDEREIQIVRSKGVESTSLLEIKLLDQALKHAWSSQELLWWCVMASITPRWNFIPAPRQEGVLNVQCDVHSA